MKRLSDQKLKEYDESYIDQIGGTLSKRFIRVDSEFIIKYFDEISKPNSSYMSYADELIRECYDPDYRDKNGKKELPLKYFSVMLKDCSTHATDNGAYLEVMNSRLANLLGVPTVYNVRAINHDVDYVMSLDFLKDGEKLVTLDDIAEFYLSNTSSGKINLEYNEFVNISEWSTLLSNVLDCAIDCRNPKMKIRKQEIIEDFCIQLLYRSLIACDTDLSPYNIGIVFDKNGYPSHLAPAHDFEFCGTIPYSLPEYFDKCINCFECLKERCPDRLNDFMDNLKKVCYYKNGQFNPVRLNKVINDSRDTTMTDGGALFYLKNLKKNISRLMFAYDKFKSSPNQELDNQDLVFEYTYDSDRYR